MNTTPATEKQITYIESLATSVLHFSENHPIGFRSYANRILGTSFDEPTPSEVTEFGEMAKSFTAAVKTADDKRAVRSEYNDHFTASAREIASRSIKELNKSEASARIDVLKMLAGLAVHA